MNATVSFARALWGWLVSVASGCTGISRKLSLKGLWEKESRVYCRIVASEGLPTKRHGGAGKDSEGSKHVPTRIPDMI